MEAKGSGDKPRKFNHPFVQACSMFIGEVLCLVVFKFLYFYYWKKHVSIIHVNMSLQYGELAVFCSYDVVPLYRQMPLVLAKLRQNLFLNLVIFSNLFPNLMPG
jgi:hypothetical protein